MKTRANWLFIPVLAVAALFFAWAGLASGQGEGPVLFALPTPTPAPPPPGGISPGDLEAQALLPDLVVDRIETFPAIPLVNQPTLISVTLKNIGDRDVTLGNSYFADLYIDPPIVPVVNYHQIISPTLGLPWGVQSFWVPKNGSYVLTTTWVFTDVKTYDLWAQVDSDNNVVEKQEHNNLGRAPVSVLTSQRFTHHTHEDFMTNYASTLDNSDASGILRLGHFVEPPFFQPGFSNGSCEITTTTVISSDYNLQSPDTRINQDVADPLAPADQVNPQLLADGQGVVIAIWEDARDDDPGTPYFLERDIYLRYSADEGRTWSTEQIVNNVTSSDQSNPAAALSQDGNLLVTWQDRRGGDYDVYAQRYILSGASLVPSGSNILVAGAIASPVGDQTDPDIAVDEDGGFHVAWQDHQYHPADHHYDIFAVSYISDGGSYQWSNVTRVNDHPSLTQQSNPAITVLDWLRVVDILYTIGPAPDYEVTVTEVISEPVRVLAVVWEDYRKANADIAISLSTDEGETFGLDSFINTDATPGAPANPLAPDQLDPDVALTRDTAVANVSVVLPNGRTTVVEVEVPVTNIHTAWEDYRNSTPTQQNRDIYYSVSQFGVTEATGNTFDPELTLGANEKINQGDARTWQTSPADQLDPSVTAFPCGGPVDPTGWNVFIAWSDGRNYDSFNYDIYYTVRSTCEGMPGGLAQNRMLTDGVHLYNFDASNPNYNDPNMDDYDAGNPPAGHQFNPAVAADIQTSWPYVLSGYVYLAWEDDRAGDPEQDFDIYFARTNLTYFNQDGFPYGAGSQISDILDSGSGDSRWYTIDWWGATDDSTYISLQTRMGRTITEVLASAWYPDRFAHQPQPWDCPALYTGAPLPGYDAPGQHIQGVISNTLVTFRPQARYLQYRVNFFTRDSRYTPEIYTVTVHYESGSGNGNSNGGGGGKKVYLPAIFK